MSGKLDDQHRRLILLKAKKDAEARAEASEAARIEAERRLAEAALVWAFKDRDGRITAMARWGDENQAWLDMIGVRPYEADVYKALGFEVFRVRVIPATEPTP